MPDDQLSRDVFATDTSDDPEFVRCISNVATNAMNYATLDSYIVVKIDNWFDSKWLGFSGTKLGGVDTWCELSDPVIPPFHPSRVLHEVIFKVNATNCLLESEPKNHKKLHIHQSSDAAARRLLSDIFPYGSAFWWSSTSLHNGRGSLMGYINQDECYWCWYIGFAKESSWRVVEQLGLSQRDRKRLF